MPTRLELPRGIALAWGVAANPQRGPKREMSVERIVEAAVETRGCRRARRRLDGRRRRAPGLHADVALPLREREGRPDPAHAGGGDRPAARDGARGGRLARALEALYREQLQLYLEHPWVLDIPITGSPTTPNSAAWMDAGLAALAETHRSRTTSAWRSMLLVTGQARWYGHGPRRLRAHRARERACTEPDHRAREDAHVPRAHHRGRRFPACARRSTRACSSTRPTRSRSASSGVSTASRPTSRRVRRARAVAAAPVGVPDDADIAGDKRFREAQKAVRDAEKALRDARKARAPGRARRARARCAAARRGAEASPLTDHTSHTGLHASHPAHRVCCSTTAGKGRSWRSCPMCAS